MGNRKNGFELGEWYHCFNQSIEKRTAFADRQDYQRFLEILYLANDESPLRRNDVDADAFEQVLLMPRTKKIVGIAAFCLMSTHFHLVMQETTEGGITSFMRKLGTAYTLYFNARHTRTGNLFLKPFRSRTMEGNRPLEDVVPYVNCAPADLYEPGWRTGNVVDLPFLEERLMAYPYSSLRSHKGLSVPTSAILEPEVLHSIRGASFEKQLRAARKYGNEGLFRSFVL